MSRSELSFYAAAALSVSTGMGLIGCGVLEAPQHWGRLSSTLVPSIDAVAFYEPKEQLGEAQSAPTAPAPVPKAIRADDPDRQIGEGDGRVALLVETSQPADTSASSGVTPSAAAPLPPRPPLGPLRSPQTAAKPKTPQHQRMAALEPSPGTTTLPSTGSGTQAKNAGVREFGSRDGGSAQRALAGSSDGPQRSVTDHAHASTEDSGGLFSWMFGGGDHPDPSSKARHRARASFASMEAITQPVPIP